MTTKHQNKTCSTKAIFNSMKQTTIKNQVSLQGIGLHTGEPAQLHFCPAPADSGIYFVRNDLPNRPSLKVEVENNGNSTTVQFYSVDGVNGTGPNSCGHFCQTFSEVCCICASIKNTWKCRICNKL